MVIKYLFPALMFFTAVWPQSPADNMKFIPGGSFQMGSNTSGGSQPVHTVELTSFWMDSTEITQKLYEEITGVNPSAMRNYSNNPVEFLTWYDAVFFCNMRSKNAGRDTVYSYNSQLGTPGNGSVFGGIEVDFTKNGFRLPTEAEWEYACRGSTDTRYYWGDDAAAADSYAWYNQNSGVMVHAVALKLPNKFGLYDMSGNVWEWCNDYFSNTYYSISPLKDPTGPTEGPNRIARGGSKGGGIYMLESAFRFGLVSPGSRYNDIGFRTVLREDYTRVPPTKVINKHFGGININKTSEALTITIVLTGADFITVNILGVRGRLINELYKKETDAGKHIIKYQGPLRQNIYLIKIQGSNFSHLEKLVIIK